MKMKLLIIMALVQIASITVAMDNKDFSNELPSKYVGFEVDESVFGLEDGFGDFNEIVIPSLDGKGNQASDKKLQSKASELIQQVVLTDNAGEKVEFSDIKIPARKKRQRDDKWNGSDELYNKNQTAAKIKKLISNAESEKKRFNCGLCKDCFTSKTSLKEHVENAHKKENPHRCLICLERHIQTSYSTSGGLARHMKKLHPEVRQLYKCPECQDYFGRSDHLGTHIRVVHEQVNQYSCSECLKNNIQISFGSQSHLTKHIRDKHPEIDVFKCFICQKIFAKGSDLNKHMAVVHKELKPWQCDVCFERGFQTSFSIQSMLTKHMREVH